MILNRRLLLGLTSRIENLWFSHLSASGPSGTLESSWRAEMVRVMSGSYESEQDGQRHDHVRDDDDRRQRHREVAAPAVEAGMVDAHALEHRPGAVEDVGGEGELGEYVERRHPRAGERGDEVGVDRPVLPTVGSGRLDAPCEVGEVEDHEQE